MEVVQGTDAFGRYLRITMFCIGVDFLYVTDQQDDSHA